jgi:hypothetical protein
MAMTLRRKLMKKSVVVLVALAVLAGNAMATYMLARGASVIKPLQFVGYVAAGFSRTTQMYNDTTGKYEALPSDAQTSTVSADVLVGFCPLSKLEVLAVAPVVSKSKGASSQFGLGDASLMLRYGLLGGVLPVKATLAAAVMMPTSAKDLVLSLGDRTLDIGLGASAQTAKIGPMVAHARLGYWINGKTNDTTKVGNQFEYVVFPDFALGRKASVFVTVSGAIKADDVISGARNVLNGAGQHSIGGGFTWNPAGPLWLKPKVAVPLAAISKGGSIPDFTIGLDLWAVVP